MNLYVINVLFFGFSVFLISIFILLKRWDELARKWFYFSLFVAGYTVGYAFVFNDFVPHDEALIAARLGNASAALIPVTWLYFICGFLNIKRRRLFWFLWPVSLILSALGLTHLAIPSLSPAKGFAHQPDPGPTLHLQTANYFLIVSYSFYLMIRSLVKEKSSERKREIISLILATIFGFIGGAGEFTLIYFRDKGIDLSFLLITYPFLMAYAMTKHHVLDIEKVADAFQRDKLAALGLLAASINHEIRNPLFVIKGHAEILLESMEKGAYRDLSGLEREKRVEQALKKTLEQASRIVEITKRLTDFSKSDLGGGIAEQINLNEVVDNVLSFVGYGLKTDNIQVEKSLPPDLILQANQKELEQIFLNLVINASQRLVSQAMSHFLYYF